ncbi:MAG: hypothetical protein RIB78_10040 [Gammaproteobacteria bacterium]
MFGIFKRFFSKKETVEELTPEEIELAGLDDEDEEDEKTQLVDTLAYHQPPKSAIAEKAKKLAKGDSD